MTSGQIGEPTLATPIASEDHVPQAVCCPHDGVVRDRRTARSGPQSDRSYVQSLSEGRPLVARMISSVVGFSG